MSGRSASDGHVSNDFSGSAQVVVQSGRIDMHLHAQPAPAVFLAPTRSSGLLVGREPEREQIRDLLPGGTVALCGMPGAGKTALALDLAYDEAVRARFPDGVLWAGLGVRAEVLRHLSGWGAAAGIRLEDVGDQSVAGWAEALHPVVAAKRYLLVVDDVWDIEHGLAFQVGGPGCAHVLTTRFPRVAAEFGGSVVKVGELLATDGVALLAALAPEAVACDPAAAERLVAQAGGLPLALTLMGHHLRVEAVAGDHRLAATLDRLRLASERLALSRREAPSAAHPSLGRGVPASLLAALDVSFTHLDAGACDALRDLAAFPAKPDSFAVSWAWAVTPDRAAITEAVHAGLLESLPDNRFSMHQVVHDYVRAQGRAAEAERRMATVLVGLLTQEDVMSPEDIEREFGNVLHALDHAHRHGMHETLLAGVDAAYTQLVRCGLYSVAETHLRHALAAARATRDPQAEARTLVRLGSAVMEQGELRAGEQYLAEGLRLAQEADLVGEIVDLLVRLGWSAGMRGNLEQARRHFSDALLGASGVESVPALQGLGWVAGLQGKHGESLTQLRSALELARQAGDPGQIADVLQVSGWMRVQAGEYAQARQLFTECLALARQAQHGSAEIDALHGLGWIAMQCGHYQDAAPRLTQALTLAEDLSYHERMPILLDLGRVLTRTGRTDEARDRFAEALRLAREQDRPEKLCDVLREFGRLEVVAGRLDAAEPLVHESLAIAERLLVRTCRVDALEALAELELARGRPDTARESLLRAMRVGRTEPASLARLRLKLAEVEENEHGVNAAADLYAAAFAGADRTGQDEVAALASFGLARAATDGREAAKLASDSLARLTEIGSPHAAAVRQWRDALPGTA